MAGADVDNEDYVNVNCHGVSLWHVDAADRSWPLPTEQRDAATHRALERISSQLSAVVRPFHYIINRHQLKPAKYKENGTLYSDVFVYGGLKIQVVNVQGVPDWRVRHVTRYEPPSLRVALTRMLPWKDRFVTFGVTLDERREGTPNRIHLPGSKALYVLQHFLCDMMSAHAYKSAYWVMMRCCLRDMLVHEDDDLLATLIVIRSGPRSLLEEDEAMLHSNRDLLLGESYLNTYQGGA